MSDEPPKTADAAIRLWLVWVAAALTAPGIQIAVEKGSERVGFGMGLIVTALAFLLIAALWPRIRQRLSAPMVVGLSGIATNPRWWFGSLALFVAVVAFYPVVQVPRWPTWLLRTEWTTLDTSLRLQFNDQGTAPQTISGNNVRWTWLTVDTIRSGAPKKLYVCDPESLKRDNLGVYPTQPSVLSGLLGGPRCETVESPTYEVTKGGVIFLAFARPISAKEIRLNSHGVALPKWDVVGLTDHLGYIRFHGTMSRMILDVEVVN